MTCVRHAAVALFLFTSFAVGCKEADNDVCTQCNAKPTDTPIKPAPAPVDENNPVELKVAKLADVLKDIEARPGKLVLVDVWADFCLPCKKEFPRLVELSKKYPTDLACISVSVDEVVDKEAALKFLRKQNATFTNYLLAEKAEAWQTHWRVVAIPAAFLYRDGKLLAQFDYEDPDKQFTYADVEKAVAKLVK